jgi:hypothetical protein
VRRRAAAAVLALVLLGACGKYGPPLRPAEAARARERAEERARERAEHEQREGAAPADAAGEKADDEEGRP